MCECVCLIDWLVWIDLDLHRDTLSQPLLCHRSRQCTRATVSLDFWKGNLVVLVWGWLTISLHGWCCPWSKKAWTKVCGHGAEATSRSTIEALELRHALSQGAALRHYAVQFTFHCTLLLLLLTAFPFLGVATTYRRFPFLPIRCIFYSDNLHVLLHCVHKSPLRPTSSPPTW